MQESSDNTLHSETEYSIRFLSTALSGTEYILEHGVTLIQRPDAEGDDDDVHILYVPGIGKEDELYLVCEIGCGLQMRLATGECMPLEENTPIYAGSLIFAIKRQADEWNDVVLSFISGGEGAAEVGQGGFPLLQKNVKKKLFGTCIVLTVLLLLIGAGWFYIHSEREMNTAVIAMAGGAEKVKSFRGNDGNIYFLTETEGARNWAIQATIHEPKISETQIIHKDDELRRITEWLNVNMLGVRFHRLSLDVPLEPVLFISQERSDLTPTIRVELVSGLKAQMPWAKEIHFTMLSDRIVAEESEEALKKVTTDYVRRYTDDGVTFSVSGELDDGQLNSLGRLIQRQKRRWPGGYVYYELELKQDWLKGKSFKYGREGYIKAERGHWYFSGPLRINTQHDDLK